MAYTRQQLETLLIGRCKNLMIAAEMDVNIGPNNHVALNDPLGWALRTSGLTVLDITAVTDADIASLPVSDLDKALDLAEYRLLQNILGNYVGVDIEVGPRSERLSQLRESLEKRLDRMGARIAAVYGIGSATLEAGTIELEFADSLDDIPTEAE